MMSPEILSILTQVAPQELRAVRDRVVPLVRSIPFKARHLEDGDEVQDKAIYDYVTRVDIETQAFLEERLGRMFPHHRIVGEEGFRALESVEGPVWIIDPLDGTYNFVHRLPLYGVSLALLYNGVPVVAVVYDMVQNEVFDAVLGDGARCNGAHVRHDPVHSAKAAVAISSGFLNWSLQQDDANAPLKSVQRVSKKFRILGSQALQLCYVAVGRLRANISQEAKIWDDAAGALMLREAGAWYSHISGASLFPLSAGSPLAKGENAWSIAAAPDVAPALVQELSQIWENA